MAEQKEAREESDPAAQEQLALACAELQPELERDQDLEGAGVKQSGKAGVHWVAARNAWSCQFGKFGPRSSRHFPVTSYMKDGKSLEEANAEALRDAIAFREQLEKQGVCKPRVALQRSGIKGVRWKKRDKCWEAKLGVNGKTLFGGLFYPKDGSPEAVERARLEAVERRREMEKHRGSAE